ncbi:NfeD family protein [Porticoccus sp. W117]|uniref:NfeD family protein n=1 Tax=Porticoccus sp. W117 TaxID=3054777 RepID=UPI0025997BC3|nr:NfeD family protein [Porticoccus sp. W117]MDM3871989.1 NfeD family protein [Porticoccus sp. W117]
MELDLAYWHWLIFGIALVAAEIFLPSFTILWFGLGAIVVGLIKAVAPEMEFATELLIWLVASCAFTVFWFKYFKPRMADRTTAGISAEAVVGETGHVIRAPVEGNRGQVRFATPVLGNDEWEFICEQDVEVGDRVSITRISGNTLVVSKK